MRRNDRAITNMASIVDILTRNTVCRLALHDTPYPYIVPLNYGFAHENGRLRLYFHCAHDGKKLDLMRQNPHVSFVVDGNHQLRGKDGACTYTYAYESVIGQGTLRAVQGEERREGLLALMRTLAPEKAFAIPDAALERVTVLRLDVAQVTGKRSPRVDA